MPLARVLIVDDDELVRNALRRDLSRLDYELHFADRATAGLDILEKTKIDIVISDKEMPGMSGLKFLRIVRQTHPEVIRILLTGHATLASAISAINEGEIYRFLEKPWDDQELKFLLLQASRRLAAGDRGP